MRSRTTLAALLLALATQPAAAEWPTTSFVPVPVTGETPHEIAEDDFGFFSSGGEAGRTGEGRVNWGEGVGVIDLSDLDMAALRRGAVAAMVDIMRMAAIDASRMEAAGFRAPLIEPLLRVEGAGSYYPLFWANDHTTGVRTDDGFGNALAWQACDYGNLSWFSGGKIIRRPFRYWIEINQVHFPFATLNAARNAGGSFWERESVRLSTTITHEVMHAVQERGFGGSCTGQAPKWLSEGTANGVANHLADRRYPDFFDRYPAYRDERRYDVSLDVRQFTGDTATYYGYDTGSFFRYLMEASGGPGADGLEIMRDVLAIPAGRAGSSAGALEALDEAIRKHSGDRGLYRILPEFLTEYASYGESRYTKRQVATGPSSTSLVPLSREKWIDDAFLHCVEFDIQPGVARMKEVSVQPLAGECIKVKWSGFTEPVALQLYAMDAGDGFGALHMGEAMRDDASGRQFCHDVTKALQRRIAEPMRKKCMLKRETRALGGAGAGVGNEAAWTSDFNLSGSGDVHFVVSNIAKDPAETKPVKFQLLVGSLEAAKTGGAHIKPRTPGGETEPVVSGMTDPQKRVHTMNGAGDRIFFDGRSIFGDGTGLGYLEGVAGAMGPGEGAGVMTLVRGGDYWVGYVGARPGQSKLGDGGLIIKDPVRLESGNPMAGVIMSGGMEHLPSGSECGYKLPAEVSIVEETRERVRFRVSGDLFDPMRAMALAGSGGASTCEVMRATWVESASFEVSLPNGALHAGDSWVERRSPPGQEVYDESDFLSGPNLGGIATSLSLAAGDAPPDVDDSDAPPDDSDATSGGPGGSAGQLVACDCRCPDPVRPDPAASPKPQCVAQCAAEWAACQANGDASVARGTEPTPESTPERREPTVEAQRKWFSRLVSDQGLAPEVEAMLVEDFATMSADTRMHLIREYRRGLP